MKRSTFVKASVPIVAINSFIGIGVYLRARELIYSSMYLAEALLATLILAIGTITLYNHLEDENSKKIITLFIALFTIGYLILSLFVDRSYILGLHVLNMFWVIVNYIRLRKTLRR